MAGRAQRLLGNARAALGTYARIGGSQHAAAISYRVFFALVPSVALLLSVLELVLPESTAERVVSWLVGVLPLPGQLGGNVIDAVERSAPPATVIGLIAVAGLLWAASGMMASVRIAFRAVWAKEIDQPFLRSKALDFALVLGTGLLIVAAFGLSLVVQLVTEASTHIVDDLGVSSPAASTLRSLGQLGGSISLTFLASLSLYRVVPPVKTRLRDAFRASVLATVAIQIATAGFSIYLQRFANFDDVYGPLGAVFALLVLVYVVSAILLVGACLTAAWGTAAGSR